MFNFTRALIRCHKGNINAYLNNRIASLTTPASVELKSNNNPSEGENAVRPKKIIKNNNIVAAAFASLNNADVSNGDLKTPFTDSQIEQAKNVNDLLGISDGAGISRQHALKVVSTLADWSSAGKIKLADFEADPRFIRLCKVLTKGSYTPRQQRGGNSSRNEDLSTIMNVTADDEAAKLVASITIAQMVKVMQSLALKRRRSTMLLRSLAFNITRSKEKLDVKQSADLLYSMATLNFPDENLLERIGQDVVASLNDSLKKSSVVGSILTSLGLLRYKDEGLLDALCTWSLKHNELCRPQDLFALFQTIAVLNFEPTNAAKLYETLIPQLTYSDSHRPTLWLDFVWSLVLLNIATPEHISSVLSEEFVKQIEIDNPASMSSKLKLLNVNAAACNLMESYSGPKLDASITRGLPARTKEKEEFVNSVLETLKNLMPSENFVTTNVNTEMGFFIDAECILDKKGSPVKTSSYNKSEHVKVAIMIQEYQDMCRGRLEPTGTNAFIVKLLAKRGYTVIQIPYSEYKIRDKLVQRVQYLEKKLKSLSQS